MPTNPERRGRLLRGLVTGLCLAHVLGVTTAIGLHAWVPTVGPALLFLDCCCVVARLRTAAGP